jgi:hypothetical protein
MARVGPLEDHDARIVAQPPVELAVADIDRVDRFGATPEQHIGKATGRGADIERHDPRRIDVEVIEPVRELDAAARDIRRTHSAHAQLDVTGDPLPRLVESLLATEHPPREDQGLRLGPAFRQTALEEQLI